MLEKEKNILNKKNQLYLRVKVQPGVSKSEISEIMDDGTCKISIKAQPEKGKANIELIKMLTKEFKVSKDNVRIISGAGSRLKLVKITT